MAAPMVSGEVALLRAQRPDLSLGKIAASWCLEELLSLTPQEVCGSTKRINVLAAVTAASLTPSPARTGASNDLGDRQSGGCPATSYLRQTSMSSSSGPRLRHPDCRWEWDLPLRRCSHLPTVLTRVSRSSPKADLAAHAIVVDRQSNFADLTIWTRFAKAHQRSRSLRYLPNRPRHPRCDSFESGAVGCVLLSDRPAHIVVHSASIAHARRIGAPSAGGRWLLPASAPRRTSD